MHKLHIQDDEGNTTVVPVTADTITIGRNDDNTIQLTERNVSRFHAKVYREENVLYVEDIRSSYGTRVNGIRITEPIPLKAQDTVQVGDYKIRYRQELAAGRPISSRQRTAPLDMSAGNVSDGTRLNLPEHAQALLHISAPGIDQEHPMRTTPIFIGSDSSNDCIVQHTDLADRHLQLRYEKRQFVLSDLTGNGVLVNGEPYRQVILSPGDDIAVGALHIQFMIGVSDASRWETEVLPVVGDYEDVESPPRQNKNLMVMIGVLVSAAILVAILFMTVFKSDDKPTPPQDREAIENNGDKNEGQVVEEDDNSAIAKDGDYLSQAKKNWADGNHDAARQALELASENPNTLKAAEELRQEFRLDEQVQELETLVSEGRFITALERELDIPDSSPVHARYVKARESARENAAQEYYDKAKLSLRDGDIRDAQRKLERIKEINAYSPYVRELGDRIDKKIKQRAAKQQRDEEQAKERDRKAREKRLREEAEKKLDSSSDTKKTDDKTKENKSGGDGSATDGMSVNELYRTARKLATKPGQRGAAIDILRKVVSRRPGHFRAHKTLGILYVQDGAYSKAEHHLKKALQIKDDPYIRGQLERIQR
ncbi:MAG: hypothetical protein CMH54_02240 [Myxococcales bacterium]|nr:hypothetical protein [Myxococcales bacterium]